MIYSHQLSTQFNILAFITSIILTPAEVISFGRMVLMASVQFQRLVQSMPRQNEAVLAAYACRLSAFP